MTHRRASADTLSKSVNRDLNARTVSLQSGQSIRWRQCVSHVYICCYCIGESLPGSVDIAVVNQDVMKLINANSVDHRRCRYRRCRPKHTLRVVLRAIKSACESMCLTSIFSSVVCTWKMCSKIYTLKLILVLLLGNHRSAGFSECI